MTEPWRRRRNPLEAVFEAPSPRFGASNTIVDPTDPASVVGGIAAPARPQGASHAAFWRFAVATTVSGYGDWLTTVALMVLLYDDTGSAAATAGYMLARVAPRLPGSTVGGLLADRYPAHLVVSTCAAVQGVVLVAIVVLAGAHLIAPIYVAVVLAQIAGAAARSAAGAVPARLVEPAWLPRANAILLGGISSAIVLGPALGAVLLFVTTPQGLLVADAASFAACALLLLTVPRPPASSPADRGPSQGTLRAAAAGLALVWRDSLLRAQMAAWLGNALATTAAGSVVVLAAVERAGGDGRVGVLYAAVGAGSVGGSVLAGLLGRRGTRGRRPVVAAAVLDTAAIATFAATPSLAASLACLVVAGGAAVLWQSWAATQLALRTPREMLGRVSAVMVSAASLGMILGALLVLALAPVLGWKPALALACAAGVAVLLLLGAGAPRRAGAAAAQRLPRLP